MSWLRHGLRLRERAHLPKRAEGGWNRRTGQRSWNQTPDRRGDKMLSRLEIRREETRTEASACPEPPPGKPPVRRVWHQSDQSDAPVCADRQQKAQQSTGTSPGWAEVNAQDGRKSSRNQDWRLCGASESVHGSDGAAGTHPAAKQSVSRAGDARSGKP